MTGICSRLWTSDLETQVYFETQLYFKSQSIQSRAISRARGANDYVLHFIQLPSQTLSIQQILIFAVRRDFWNE